MLTKTSLEPLISADDIQRRVGELGRQLTQDYAARCPLALCILKGAWMFFADLVRHVQVPMECEFVSVSSYASRMVSSGYVRFRSDLSENVRGRHVLIVEDIVDTGLTLSRLCERLQAQGSADVRVCALLDKPERRQVSVTLDYVGFTIPDRFVVGYGLDYDEHYRNLPYITVLDTR